MRLDEVVLRALERKPELRYQQASILKTQVETIASTPAAASPAATVPWMYRGLDYRSKATLFGLPWLHVTSGMDPATGRQRVAKGIIAIGGIAKGVVAIGGVAMGGLAFGGLAVGVFAYGGLALGLLALGGGAVALVAALGGGAIAPIALGGGAMGYFAYGGGALGVHVLDAMTKDPAAQRFFLPWAKTLLAHFQLINAILFVPMLAIGIGVPLWLQRRMARHGSDGGSNEPPPPAEPGVAPGRAERELKRGGIVLVGCRNGQRVIVWRGVANAFFAILGCVLIATLVVRFFIPMGEEVLILAVLFAALLTTGGVVMGIQTPVERLTPLDDFLPDGSRREEAHTGVAKPRHLRRFSFNRGNLWKLWAVLAVGLGFVFAQHKAITSYLGLGSSPQSSQVQARHPGKAAATAQDPSFGPVIERVLADPDDQRDNETLSLRSGKLASVLRGVAAGGGGASGVC